MGKKLGHRGRALALAAALLLLSACGADANGDATTARSPAPETEPVESAVQPAESTPPLETESAPETETPVPETTPPVEEDGPVTGLVAEGPAVEESWFADAVFLGDSRTDGLMLFSGIKSATFISHQGLSVFNIDETDCIDRNGEKVTVLEALADQQFAKVYLMLGVNELGYPSVKSFQDTYAELVDQIKALEPDATIYLQTIIPVNETVGAEKGMSKYITNARIKEYNAAIAQVAEDKDVALVDVAEAFWDENDSLPADYTSDGVHLTRAGYIHWFEYLQTHTGSSGETTADPVPTPSEAVSAESGS